MNQPKLRLERRSQQNETPVIGGVVMLTPALGEGYWSYRVIVGEHQAVVGFPKFSTIGIGFAVEEDWNTNLPFTCDTEAIWKHIAHNKGDEGIPDEWCIEAIRLVQEAVYADRSAGES